MAKFWEQDWFKDAAPWVGGALALGALGAYSSGAFDGFFSAPSEGVGGDYTSALTGGEGANLPTSLPEEAITGPAAGGAATQVLGEAARGAGNIFDKVPDGMKPSGFQTGIPALDNIIGVASRNPALVLGALGVGASMLGNSSQRPLAGPTAEELRNQDTARWNAIPVQSGPRRRVVSPVGGGGGRERNYFENYASGGALRPSNHLRGPGDGMSDDIPAVAHGEGGPRPINVADGEYVIPADVVSGIGNGSSEAGVRQLDALLRRVRQERHGTSKQPPAIDPASVMPA